MIYLYLLSWVTSNDKSITTPKTRTKIHKHTGVWVRPHIYVCLGVHFRCGSILFVLEMQNVSGQLGIFLWCPTKSKPLDEKIDESETLHENHHKNEGGFALLPRNCTYYNHMLYLPQRQALLTTL